MGWGGMNAAGRKSAAGTGLQASHSKHSGYPDSRRNPGGSSKPGCELRRWRHWIHNLRTSTYTITSGCESSHNLKAPVHHGGPPQFFLRPFAGRNHNLRRSAPAKCGPLRAFRRGGTTVSYHYVSRRLHSDAKSSPMATQVAVAPNGKL